MTKLSAVPFCAAYGHTARVAISLFDVLLAGLAGLISLLLLITSSYYVYTHIC